MGRRAFKSEWLKNSKGEICGLNLGADYCAEHEFGIDRLLQDLKVDSTNKNGIESRMIKDFDSTKLNFKKTKTKSILSFNNPIENNIQRNNPEALKCEWDSKDFLITTRSKDDSKNLEQLHQAFLNKDIAVWVGGAGVFQNGGIILAIVSKVDDRDKETMLKADIDKKELKEAAEATGIYDLLTKNGKRYYALSPHWLSGDKQSNYPVIFWLNPMDQQNNNYGWFTVEELTSWANNEGPIMKNALSEEA